MQFNPHQRARILIDQALVRGISQHKQNWLRGHIEGCAECSKYGELSGKIVRGLRTVSFDIDPTMHVRVQEAVSTHVRGQVVEQAQVGNAWGLTIQRLRPLLAMNWSRWALAATVLLMLAATPIYRLVQEARRDAEMDVSATALMESMDTRLSRAVPAAMEPLVKPVFNEDDQKDRVRHGGSR